MEGQAAMLTDGIGFVGQFENKQNSKIAGKVGYQVFPAGAAGSKPLIGTWGIAVSGLSKKKEAAWLFVQYMSSAETSLHFLNAGGNTTRLSPWKSPQFTNAKAEWIKAILNTYKVGVEGNYVPPSVKNVSLARDIIGQVIITAIAGGNVEQAANEAQNKLIKLYLEEKGK